MANKRIQGITIEIGGDTSKLQSALKGVDAELRKTQGNLKDINKLLKLDPGNTELLVQKQKNLQDSIKATEDRLKTLKSTQTDSLSPDQYDALQREIIETEQRLRGMEDEYKSFGSVAQQKIAAVGQAMQEAGNHVSDFGRKMQDIGNVVPGKLKQIGSAINDHVLQPMLQVAKVAGTAAFGATTALTKLAVDQKAEYEQLVGGVGKLYGDAAAKVVKNAKSAYKSAGKSANDYMKTVTAFSASLITSLGGNTEKAARVADMAIRDMSDNANTFGTDIASVEATYQSLAKQQYTTLDNLKLGYAGTKAGMEQLIRDAERMDQTFQVTHKTVKKGKEVNDELAYSYADIVQAIHIVQDNMGVTGTTANEAAKTIEGSWNMVKASWTNLLTAIGSGEDVKGAVKSTVSAAAVWLKDNLFPTIKMSLGGLSEVFDYVLDRVIFYLPEIAKVVFEWLGKIPEWIDEHIVSKLPWLFESLYITISQTLWSISDSIADWLGDGSTTSEIFTGLKTSLDNIIDAVKDIGGALSRLWNGTLKPYLQPKLKAFITSTLPKLTDVIGEIADGISGVIDWFNDLDPEIKNTILDIGLAIIAGSAAVSGIGSIITKISGAGGLIGVIKTLIGWLTGPAGIIFALGSVAAWAIVHWDDIKTTFSNAMDVIHDKMKEWLDGVNQWFNDLNTKISNVVGTITRGIRKIIKNAKDTIKGYFDSIINWAEEALRKIGLIKKPKTTYTYATPGSGAGRSDLYRANGGPVFEGQRAIVGEYAPEYLRVVNGHAVVTPITNQPARMGGDTTVNITINPQPGQSAEQIAAAVKRVFVREMQQREAAYA